MKQDENQAFVSIYCFLFRFITFPVWFHQGFDGHPKSRGSVQDPAWECSCVTEHSQARHFALARRDNRRNRSKRKRIEKSVCQRRSKSSSSPWHSQRNANCISRRLVVVSSPSTDGTRIRGCSNQCFSATLLKEGSCSSKEFSSQFSLSVPRWR